MTTLSRASIEKAFKSDEKILAAATKISQELTNGDYHFEALADELGFAMTSADLNQRIAGTKFLSAVLNALPKDYLNAKELKYMTTYYVNGLRDHHGVISALIDGLHALVSMQSLPAENVPELLRAFFQYTNSQSQTRTDRTKLFNIFQYLIQHFPTELTEMSDFLSGLVESIDGERDPRNLDIIFSFMPQFMADFPLQHLAEELFEIFACYFPVDFNPSKQDPEAVTRDVLSEKLSNCLVANEQFAAWTVALALEKLDSELLVAKLDSIELLRKAALRFAPTALEPHFTEIWQALKMETFPGSDNAEVQRAALKALAELLKAAAKESTISHNYQAAILGVVLPHLSDVHQRLYEPAAKIALMCVSGDAAYAGDKILHTILLKLQESKQQLPQDEQRLQFYRLITEVYRMADMRQALQQLDRAIALPLQDDVIAVLRICESESLEGSEQQLELPTAAVKVLSECAPVLSEPQRALIYKALVHIISHPRIDLEFKTLTVSLGALQPVELQSNVLDVCLSSFAVYSQFIKRKVYANLLPLLPLIAFTQRILDLILKQLFTPTTVEPSRRLALEAFIALLQQQDQRFIVELQQECNLIDKLIKLAQNDTEMPMENLELVAASLSRLMQQLPVSEQSAIVSEYLPELQLELASHLFVAKGLLGFLHKDISLDDHFERLLNDLTELTLTSKDPKLRTIANHLLCSMVNKMEHTPANQSHLKRTLSRLMAEVKKGDACAVEVLGWIAKGLVIAGFAEASDIVGDLGDLLKHPTLCHAAALAFDVIAVENPELDLPVVKFLYKQKLFQTILSKLDAKLLSICLHHMNALIYVLKATPHSVLKLNIEKIGPLLFKVLESHNSVKTLCIALGICENFIKHQDAYFQAHLTHFIPSCLELSIKKQDQNMPVRIAALQLLYDITKYPTFVLLPHKVDVTLALAPTLDDPKRLVRNMAVQARNAWFLVGEPGGD
ncbi:MMS19 nucleotide excision repair protein homolog [Drosophila busckii]|uniref:MMS19 nucleotide excision repair protein homolog n=1 Tax=Drosophila busckii TaxID=30019 RepID=UPI00083EC490|nr:MMS19 nucleotide excision repair protein homolog [Drosophila busckii]